MGKTTRSCHIRTYTYLIQHLKAALEFRVQPVGLKHGAPDEVDCLMVHVRYGQRAGADVAHVASKDCRIEASLLMCTPRPQE